MVNTREFGRFTNCRERSQLQCGKGQLSAGLLSCRSAWESAASARSAPRIVPPSALFPSRYPIAFNDFVRSFPFVLPFFLESIKAVCLRGNRSWRLGSRCQSTRCCRCRNWRNWRRWRWRGCRCCRRRFGAIKEFIKHGNAMVAVAGSGSNRVVFMVGGLDK